MHLHIHENEETGGKLTQEVVWKKERYRPYGFTFRSSRRGQNERSMATRNRVDTEKKQSKEHELKCDGGGRAKEKERERERGGGGGGGEEREKIEWGIYVYIYVCMICICMPQWVEWGNATSSLYNDPHPLSIYICMYAQETTYIHVLRLNSALSLSLGRRSIHIHILSLDGL